LNCLSDDYNVKEFKFYPLAKQEAYYWFDIPWKSVFWRDGLSNRSDQRGYTSHSPDKQPVMAKKIGKNLIFKLVRFGSASRTNPEVFGGYKRYPAVWQNDAFSPTIEAYALPVWVFLTVL